MRVQAPGNQLGQQDRSLSAAAVITPATRAASSGTCCKRCREQNEPVLQGWEIKMFKDVNGATAGRSDFAARRLPLTDTTDANGLKALAGIAYSAKSCKTPGRSLSPGTVCAFDATLGDAGWAVTLSSGDEDLTTTGNFQRVDRGRR
jgi:hypothetical protein